MDFASAAILGVAGEELGRIQTEFLDKDLLLHDAATGAALWQDFEKGKRLALRWKWPWMKPGGPPGHRRR